jgi:hypothetical protein
MNGKEKFVGLGLEVALILAHLAVLTGCASDGVQATEVRELPRYGIDLTMEQVGGEIKLTGTAPDFEGWEFYIFQLDLTTGEEEFVTSTTIREGDLSTTVTGSINNPWGFQVGVNICNPVNFPQSGNESDNSLRVILTCPPPPVPGATDS